MDTQLVPNAVSLIFNAVLAAEDIKYKKISGLHAHLYLLCGLVFGAVMHSFKELALSMLPGMLVLLFAYLSDEKIGYGDGLVILSTGGFIGCERSLFVIIAGIVLSGVFSLGLMLFELIRKRKLKTDSSIPFIPFLLMGQLIMLVCLKEV